MCDSRRGYSLGGSLLCSAPWPVFRTHCTPEKQILGPWLGNRNLTLVAQSETSLRLSKETPESKQAEGHCCLCQLQGQLQVPLPLVYMLLVVDAGFKQLPQDSLNSAFAIFLQEDCIVQTEERGTSCSFWQCSPASLRSLSFRASLHSTSRLTRKLQFMGLSLPLRTCLQGNYGQDRFSKSFR